MDLIQLKTYLKAQKLTPLQDMVLHFQTEVGTIRPLLAIWIGKGKVRQVPGAAPSCKGCCQCDPAGIEVYEWLD